ncbi:MAG: anaerobic ribonucleoside-triphosphate reductase activating protein [Fusobacteria bacterium]|nr:anaerobic ribonucleoside-triphosphate reductase activating protein [Fusobacteriota bacterium]
MKIGGYRTLSTVDYPGKIVATIFTVGCNFWCEYCHNYQFINETEYQEWLNFDEVLSHLKKRENLLDGVCITGGEPLIHFENIVEMIKQIKKACPSFKIKLDSNGSSLSKIKAITPYIDYIAVDFKGFDYYNYSKAPIELEAIIHYLSSVKMPYEIRLTLYPEYFPKKDFDKVVKILKNAEKVSIQQYKSENVRVVKTPYSHDVLNDLKERFEKYGSSVTVKY